MQKNRNNPAHGKKSGKTEFQIESLLPVGKENAITTAELVEGLEHTIVDCWKCLKYATFSRWNCSTDKRKNQAVPTIYPQ